MKEEKEDTTKEKRDYLYTICLFKLDCNNVAFVSFVAFHRAEPTSIVYASNVDIFLSTQFYRIRIVTWLNPSPLSLRRSV